MAYIAAGSIARSAAQHTNNAMAGCSPITAAATVAPRQRRPRLAAQPHPPSDKISTSISRKSHRTVRPSVGTGHRTCQACPLYRSVPPQTDCIRHRSRLDRTGNRRGPGRKTSPYFACQCEANLGNRTSLFPLNKITSKWNPQ